MIYSTCSFNKALLAFACLNLILLLGSCYTARWYERGNAIVSSKYWKVRVFSYPSEDFDSTGTWGILFRVFPKNHTPIKLAYHIDSATVEIDRIDTTYSLAVDTIWVRYFPDTSKLTFDLWSEPFSYPFNETSKVTISSTIKTYNKDNWQLVEEASIFFSGSFVVKRRNKIFPGN